MNETELRAEVNWRKRQAKMHIAQIRNLESFLRRILPEYLRSRRCRAGQANRKNPVNNVYLLERAA